jgi:hypothetical protein
MQVNVRVRATGKRVQPEQHALAEAFEWEEPTIY